jgi:mRNA interferase MazF
MRRGDIYWVDFEAVRGAEGGRTKPAVIVSNNAANAAAERRGKGIITVVPITSSIDRVFPFQVPLAAADCGLTADSKAQAEQVRAVGADRLRGRIGAVPTPSLRQIDEAIRLHLSL